MRRSTVPAALALALVTLTGCNDSSRSEPSAATASSEAPSPSTSSAAPRPDESASAEAEEGPTAPETADGVRLPTSQVAAASLHKAVLGESSASTAEEKAVVDAWMTYWQGAADTYYLYKESADFKRVARGRARSDILEYAERLRSHKRRVVGWARDNVTAVKVEGDTATVRDCTKNFTFSVDEEGEPLTRPDPWYDVTGTLEKSQGAWTVTQQRTKVLKESCLS